MLRLDETNKAELPETIGRNRPLPSVRYSVGHRRQRRQCPLAPVHGQIRQLRQRPGQVVERRNRQPLAGPDHRVEDGQPLATRVAACEQPVLSSQRYRPDTLFRPVVVDGQPSVSRKAQ